MPYMRGSFYEFMRSIRACGHGHLHMYITYVVGCNAMALLAVAELVLLLCGHARWYRWYLLLLCFLLATLEVQHLLLAAGSSLAVLQQTCNPQHHSKKASQETTRAARRSGANPERVYTLSACNPAARAAAFTMAMTNFNCS